MTNLTPEQLYKLALQAGFSAQDAVTQTAISLAENRASDPTVLSPPNKNGSVDAGLNQINQSWWAQFGGLSAILDPLKNFQAALAIKAIQGWDAWSTYTPPGAASGSGIWRTFLPQARSAAQAVQGSGFDPNAGDSSTSSSATSAAAPGAAAVAVGMPLADLASSTSAQLAAIGSQGQQIADSTASGVPGAIQNVARGIGGLSSGVGSFFGLIAKAIADLSDTRFWWRVLLVAFGVAAVTIGLILYVRPPIEKLAAAAAAAA